MSAVLVTGAGGMLGRKLVAALARDRRGLERIIALDVRPPAERLEGVEYVTLDVRSPELGDLVAARRPDVVVHLAAIVTPGPGCDRATQHAVDVGGTENLLAGCARAGVRKLVVTSSGAAYGYHADNAPLLDEDAPLRGNVEFAYADHKRIVEELLARARAEHPEMAQLVLRVGTVLGDAVENQITSLFDKPVIVGVKGSSTPWNFVWDEDVVGCLAAGVHGGAAGIYNVAGDGVMTLREIAAAMGRPYVALPPAVLEGALAILARGGATRYGPEQVAFLRWRPVLSNARAKRDLGGLPRVSTREAFGRWRAARVRRQVVVVTGAASGIGRALAKRFAEGGARVAMLDLDAPGLERAVRALRGADHEVAGHACDVRDAAQVERVMGEVVDRWGGIDVLVNNAGISHRSLLAETDPAVLRRVMDVNFFGAAHCTRAALPSLVARRGTIVAVSSVAGFAPLVGRTGYAASKHALHGFFDSLRAEVAGQGVHVLLACPSFTDTSIDANALGGDGARLGGARKQVVGRTASPHEVACEIHDAVVRRKTLLVLSPVGKASWWLSRVAPRLYARAMRARVGKELGI